MKTIEEAALENAIYKHNDDQTIQELMSDSFKAGVEFAQRWIPVEEELPNLFSIELYFVKGTYNHKIYGDLDWYGVTRLKSIVEGNPIWHKYENKEIKITHWRKIEPK